MEQLIKHFVRKAPGVWQCVTLAEFVLLQGRIQVPAGTLLESGTPFMGVDIAQLLEEQRTRAMKAA